MRWDLYTSAEKMQVLWVCIGLPVLLLAAWLVRDWMDAGGSKKARKAAKALGSRTDEMEHAISTQAQAIAYRVTQAGILACLYYRLLVKGQAAMELCALLVVSGMAEVAVILVQTFRKAKDDEACFYDFAVLFFRLARRSTPHDRFNSCLYLKDIKRFCDVIICTVL